MCARKEIRANGFSLEKKDYYIATLLVFICFTLAYFRIVDGVCGIFHDDGIYVATAKSIAEGTGYRLINLPSSPLQTKYPFLYPAILAIIWKINPNFPDNLTVMQIGSAAFGAIRVATRPHSRRSPSSPCCLRRAGRFGLTSNAKSGCNSEAESGFRSTLVLSTPEPLCAIPLERACWSSSRTA